MTGPAIKRRCDLDQGRTLNGHRWSTRIAILRGRHLIGLSNANRTAACVAVDEEVEVKIALDTDPMAVEVPADLTAALTDDAAARATFDRLTVSQRRQHVRVIEQRRSRRPGLTASRRPSGSFASSRTAN